MRYSVNRKYRDIIAEIEQRELRKNKKIIFKKKTCRIIKNFFDYFLTKIKSVFMFLLY